MAGVGVATGVAVGLGVGVGVAVQTGRLASRVFDRFENIVTPPTANILVPPDVESVTVPGLSRGSENDVPARQEFA